MIFVLIVFGIIGGALYYRKKRLQAAENKSDAELDSDVEKSDMIDELGVPLTKDSNLPKSKPFDSKKETAIIEQEDSSIQ